MPALMASLCVSRLPGCGPEYSALKLARSREGTLPRDSLPAAAEVFAGLPPPLPDDGGIREAVRAMRAADGLLLGGLDDDPTGTQAGHGIEAVTVLDGGARRAALARAAGACFV